MYVRDYALADAYAGLVLVERDISELMRADARLQPSDGPQLLVWRGALANDALDSFMSSRSWPLALLEDLPPGQGWTWTLTTGDGDATVTEATQILDAVRRASGVNGQPVGNVLATLSIREYEERDSNAGDIAWWRSRRLQGALTVGFGGVLVDSIIRLLERAAAAGCELFVEQLSIILAKDPAALIAAPTPTLHSDMYYGVRETAIVSIIEHGWESLGGAMFLPTCRMNQLWHMRPLNLSKIERQLANEPLIISCSGDVLIYDGMIGPDGQRNARNGIPHISPDVAGKSSRLAILMFNRRESNVA